jgi:molybdopterin biosynthesis enzyme
MLGSENIHRPSVKAKLEKPIASNLGVRSYLRAFLSEDGKSVRAIPDQEEMSTLADSNALIAVPEDATKLSAGDQVAVVVLRRRYF